MLPAAAAIELIHTYSLIHDDLPAMDDDELRRGMPTSHVKFGENVAILAGDGLFAEAMRLFCERQQGEPERVMAGARRAGQRHGRGRHGRRPVRGRHHLRRQRRRQRPASADPEALRADARPEDRATDRSQRRRRTRVGGVPETERIPYRRFAEELGVLFQIVDDILDVTGSDEELGKPSGSDERHGKLTYVSAFGLERARELASESHRNARAGARPRRIRGPTIWPGSPTSSTPGIPDASESDKPTRTTPSACCDTVDGPDDLTELSTTSSSSSLAQEARELIIDTIGEIGGHFGANLGTCELAVALHSLLDSPRDKILWDVGHQAYPHKVLTGRRDHLGTIRQYEGLAPFCSMFESEHDIMGAGHASTSIGYAVGLKEAMRQGIGEDGKVVAVIGDGALTGGVAYEALHHAGGLQTPIVIVLNDNGMSISPNVGAISRYFNRDRG